MRYIVVSADIELDETGGDELLHSEDIETKEFLSCGRDDPANHDPVAVHPHFEETDNFSSREANILAFDFEAEIFIAPTFDLDCLLEREKDVMERRRVMS